VLLEAEDEQLLLAGDLLVHAVQLGNVDVGYAHESDPELAAASRRTVLASLRRDALLATAHLTRPFVALAEAPPVRADPRPRP
jgi:glyoxylase-like metal-dependent hydrolase (beta-lactamase superfamily II)